jgi:hypothetical protein
VLIDDAELPDNRGALPDDIAGLLDRQLIQIRQANRVGDIEALREEIEKAGFRRLPDSREDFSGQGFSDKLLLDVVVRLRQLQQRQRAEFVGRRDLLRELDRLFNRKTFRFDLRPSVGVQNSVGPIVSTPRIRRRKCCGTGSET